MSTTITFYDLLGVIDLDDPDEAAANIWPSHLVQGTIGKRDSLNLAETADIVKDLQNVLTFHNVRPGADPDRVGIIADMLVGPITPAFPLVLTTMPDIEIHLLETSSHPARIAVTAGDDGVEFIIEALPVEILLPRGFITPLGPLKTSDPLPDVTQANSFVSGQHDTLTVTLSALKPSSISVHIKIRLTETEGIMIEPAVPLSIGACRFLTLPCRGIHDLNLFPSPLLGIGPEDEDHYGDQALEWARHPLLDAGESDFGLFTIRTLDLDNTREPLSSIVNFINPDETNGQPQSFVEILNAEKREAKKAELVLENLAFPIGNIVPLPSHFLVGLRRELGPQDDPGGAYNLGGLAIPLKGLPSFFGKYLLIEQLLFRSVPNGDVQATSGDDRQMAFVKLALVDDPAGEGKGATIELTDEWTVLAGYRQQPGRKVFKLFGAQFTLLGVRAGVSVQRLIDGNSFFKSSVLVADLEITLGEAKSSSFGAVSIKNDGNAATGVIIHDIGLRFGSFAFKSFWKTGGTSFNAFDIIRLEIDEYGLVTEPSGALYMSFSGSIPLPAGRDAGEPVTSGGEINDDGDIKNGVGFRFYRLRGKVTGAEEAPFLLIDGIGLSVRYGSFGITGTGILSETVRDAHRYKEAGLSIQLQFSLGTNDDKESYALGGLFFYGKVTGPTHNFSYGMVGLNASPIPIFGGIILRNVRLLFAWNMVPNLGPVNASGASAMRLYEWYEANQNALAMPEGRNLGLSGWSPEDDAWTVAIGAGMDVGSRGIYLDAFFVYLNAEGGNGLLAGLKVFLLGSEKPIGFAVFEIDGDRWSISAGLSLGIENVVGRKLPLFEDIPFLTGSFYHTNKPNTTAIGQFSDPSSWLAIHLGGDKGKLFGLFTIEFFAGVCMQIVDLPEGPRVFAFRTSVTGSTRLFKVGGIDFYLTLAVTAGVWRTESKVSGFLVFFEGGVNIDVFYVFHFGASARVELTYLGPDPAYRRFATEFKIHTPWWLPDASFRWCSETNTPALEQMQVLSTPVVESAAFQLSTPEPVVLTALSPVAGPSIDDKAVYGITEMADATGVIPAASLADIIPVSVDSALSLHFNSAVDDLLVFGQNTVSGAGADKSADVSTICELVEFGIRRRPQGTSNWQFLIDPAKSRVESLNGLSAEEREIRMRQKVRLRWDADFKREGNPDPRRLLINTDTPFLQVVLNLEGDEALVRNQPGWPCCSEDKPSVQWHNLDFKQIDPGVRDQPVHYFSDSSSSLFWNILPPIIGSGQVVPASTKVAKMNAGMALPTLLANILPTGVPPGRKLFARLTFEEVAQQVEIVVKWRAMHMNRTLVVLAFHGLTSIEEQQFKLSQSSPSNITFNRPDGITEILLILDGRGGTARGGSIVEWISMRFRTVQEVQTNMLYDARCGAGDTGASQPGGRFAWLPNHEYEIQWKTKVKVGHESTGVLAQEVPQTLRFHTKGLPGLNWMERHGSEFEPYIEVKYPGSRRYLYREEPVMLVLNEKSDIFRIADPQDPNAPAERRQQIDWTLVVSRVGGEGPNERITKPSKDWIVENRQESPPVTPGRNPLVAGLVMTILDRQATSLDPLWIRFEAVRASPFSCNTRPSTPPSRVLVHQPHDPEPQAVPEIWPAQAVLRAGVQIKKSGSTSFVERLPFESGDETALATTFSSPWIVEDGSIGPVSDTGDAISLAIFGENTWRNTHISLLIDPSDGESGIAVAVRGTPDGADALLFVINEPTRELQAIRRQDTTHELLETIALPETVNAPFTLDVHGYEDVWEVSVGEANIKRPRDSAELGKLALVVRGAGRIGALRVEPIDLYRFDFNTSRFLDFNEHIQSWKGSLDRLPDAAPVIQNINQLMSTTPLSFLMTPNSDPNIRQRAFDQWCSDLGVFLRTSAERLELSQPSGRGGAPYLILETPEPIRFCEDVTIVMHSVDDETIKVRLAILSNGLETRAFLVPVKNSGRPTLLPVGEYELVWSLDRTRFRTSIIDEFSRLKQIVKMKITIE